MEGERCEHLNMGTPQMSIKVLIVNQPLEVFNLELKTTIMMN